MMIYWTDTAGERILWCCFYCNRSLLTDMPECDCTEMSLIKNGNGYFSDVETYFRCAWTILIRLNWNSVSYLN